MDTPVVVFNAPLDGAASRNQSLASSETFNAGLDGDGLPDDIGQTVCNRGGAAVVDTKYDGIGVESRKASLDRRLLGDARGEGISSHWSL